jgi:hypothetical protein
MLVAVSQWKSRETDPLVCGLGSHDNDFEKNMQTIEWKTRISVQVDAELKIGELVVNLKLKGTIVTPRLAPGLKIMTDAKAFVSNCAKFPASSKLKVIASVGLDHRLVLLQGRSRWRLHLVTTTIVSS